MLLICFISVFFCFSIYILCFFFFFFKQKTAYEMRISGWSSGVCSSDLLGFVALALVLAKQPLLLVGLEAVHPVAAHVARGDAGLFGILTRQLGQFLAALLRQIGDRQPQRLSIGDRVEPKPRRADRLVDRADIGFIPHLQDRKSTRLNSSH